MFHVLSATINKIKISKVYIWNYLSKVPKNEVRGHYLYSQSDS